MEYKSPMITRRSIFVGFAGLLATPAIVRASSLMKLSIPPTYPWWTASPAGLMRVRKMYPEQVAQDLLSVQPIDPKPFFDLYEMTRPTREFPRGRTITIS